MKFVAGIIVFTSYVPPAPPIPNGGGSKFIQGAFVTNITQSALPVSSDIVYNQQQMILPLIFGSLLILGLLIVVIKFRRRSNAN